jgi:hypothetical protein
MHNEDSEFLTDDPVWNLLLRRAGRAGDPSTTALKEMIMTIAATGTAIQTTMNNAMAEQRNLCAQLDAGTIEVGEFTAAMARNAAKIAAAKQLKELQDQTNSR